MAGKLIDVAAMSKEINDKSRLIDKAQKKQKNTKTKSLTQRRRRKALFKPEMSKAAKLGFKSKPRTKEKTFEVEEIRAIKAHAGEKTLFLVKWKDYEEKDNSWEPEESFLDKSLLSEFLKSKIHSTGTWQYFAEVAQNGKPQGWLEFSKETADIVESAYWNHLANKLAPTTVKFTVLQKFEYLLNFETMEQESLSGGARTKRQVRRLLLD